MEPKYFLQTGLKRKILINLPDLDNMHKINPTHKKA